MFHCRGDGCDLSGSSDLDPDLTCIWPGTYNKDDCYATYGFCLPDMFGVCYWKDNRKLGGCLQKEGGVIPYYWKVPVKTNNDEQTITLKLNYNYYRATTKFSWHYPQIDLCVPEADMFSKVLVPIYDRRAGVTKLNKCRMVHMYISIIFKTMA